jgi:hypothetical protein
MHADLVLSTSLESDLDKRGFRISFEHVYMGDGELSSGSLLRRVNAVRGVLGKIGTKGKVFFLYLSFRQGDVFSAGRVVLELVLQPLLRFYGLCEDEEPGSFSIQPMDNKEFLRRAFRIQIGAQERVQRFDALRFSGHRQQALRLVHDNQAFVFKYDSEAVF